MCAAMEPQRAAEAMGTAQLPGLLARRLISRHPPTLRMVIEALQAQDQNRKKGVSVIAIKRFILTKYPTVDPIRLKYLLKNALNKGLSRGDLVRPPNSSAMGATGRFKLPPKKQQQKKQPHRQADPDREEVLKPRQKRTTKPPQPATAGARQQGTKEEKPPVAKKPKAVKKPKAKTMDTQPAAAKPESDGVKPPKAAARPRAPAKGRSGHPVAPAAEDAGGGHGSNPGGAGGKGAQKVPAAKSKRKDPREAQQDPPEAKGGQGKVRKARATPAAGRGAAGQRKAAATVGTKAP